MILDKHQSHAGKHQNRPFIGCKGQWIGVRIIELQRQIVFCNTFLYYFLGVLFYAGLLGCVVSLATIVNMQKFDNSRGLYVIWSAAMLFSAIGWLAGGKYLLEWLFAQPKAVLSRHEKKLEMFRGKTLIRTLYGREIKSADILETTFNSDGDKIPNYTVMLRLAPDEIRLLTTDKKMQAEQALEHVRALMPRREPYPE